MARNALCARKFDGAKKVLRVGEKLNGSLHINILSSFSINSMGNLPHNNIALGIRPSPDRSSCINFSFFGYKLA